MAKAGAKPTKAKPKSGNTIVGKVCETCAAFVGEKSGPSGLDSRIKVVIPAGLCHCNPVPVAKRADEWCLQWVRSR